MPDALPHQVSPIDVMRLAIAEYDALKASCDALQSQLYLWKETAAHLEKLVAIYQLRHGTLKQMGDDPDLEKILWLANNGRLLLTYDWNEAGLTLGDPPKFLTRAQLARLTVPESGA